MKVYSFLYIFLCTDVLYAKFTDKSDEELWSLVRHAPQGLQNPNITINNGQEVSASAHTEMNHYGKELFNRFKEESITILTLLNQYKWQLGIGSTVWLYFYIHYILYYYSSMTYQSHSWINWRKEISTEQLVGYNHQTLAQDLLKSVQVRYLDVQNQGNLLLPIAQFLKDLDSEIQDAKKYVWWYELLHRFYGEYTFMLQAAKYEQVKDGIMRLEFLKSLFLSWFTKYIVLGNV